MNLTSTFQEVPIFHPKGWYFDTLKWNHLAPFGRHVQLVGRTELRLMPKLPFLSETQSFFHIFSIGVIPERLGQNHAKHIKVEDAYVKVNVWNALRILISRTCYRWMLLSVLGIPAPFTPSNEFWGVCLMSGVPKNNFKIAISRKRSNKSLENYSRCSAINLRCEKTKSIRKLNQQISQTNLNFQKFQQSTRNIISYIHVISTFISSSVHPLTLVRCVLSGDVWELSTSRPPRRCGCGTTLVEVHSITLMCDICSNVGGIDLAKTQIYGIFFSPYYCYCTAKNLGGLQYLQHKPKMQWLPLHFSPAKILGNFWELELRALVEQ